MAAPKPEKPIIYSERREMWAAKSDTKILSQLSRGGSMLLLDWLTALLTLIIRHSPALAATQAKVEDYNKLKAGPKRRSWDPIHKTWRKSRGQEQQAPAPEAPEEPKP